MEKQSLKNRKVNMKTYLITITLITTIFSAAFFVHAQLPSYTSPDLYLDASTAPYSYMIETDGFSWYRMINGRTGKVEMSSTNASAIGNAAEGNTSILGGGTVVWKAGNYTLTNSIIKLENVRDLGEGLATHLSLANNANCPIFRFGSYAPTRCEIGNMLLDGNILNNDGNGRGIYFNSSGLNTIVPNDITDWNYIHDIYVYNTQGDPILIDNLGQGSGSIRFRIERVHWVGGGYYVSYGGLALIGVYDSFVSDIVGSVGNKPDLYMRYCNHMTLGGTNYLGGSYHEGIYLDNCNWNTFGGSWILDSFGTNGIKLTGYYGCMWNAFENFQIRPTTVFDMPDNTYSGVHVEGGGGRNSYGNQFIGFTICNWTTTNTLKYGFRFESTTNNNTVNGLTINSQIIGTTAWSDAGTGNMNNAYAYQLFAGT